MLTFIYNLVPAYYKQDYNYVKVIADIHNLPSLPTRRETVVMLPGPD